MTRLADIPPFQPGKSWADWESATSKIDALVYAETRREYIRRENAALQQKMDDHDRKRGKKKAA